MQFEGMSSQTIDAKGRLCIPSRHHALIKEFANGLMSVTCHPQGTHLMIYTRPQWEQFKNTVIPLPADAQTWRRLLLGRVSHVELDSSGRIPLTPELRRAAQIDRNVVLLGVGTHMELWDRAAYEQLEKDAKETVAPASFSHIIF